MNPPPLAKRLVALTAAISLVASFAILFVAVPEGIDEYVDTPESTTTVPVVKGSVRSQLDTLSVGNVTSCAVEVLPRVWIAATDSLSDETEGTVSGNDTPNQKVRLFRSPVIPYLLVAAERRDDIPKNTDFGKLEVSLSRLTQASVVDCMNQHEMTVRQTPTQFADSTETPVYVSGDIRGMGIVLDEDKSFLGIVGEHDHSQWFFQLSELSRLINTVR